MLKETDSVSYRIPLITPDFGELGAEDLAWVAQNQVPAPNRVIETFEGQLAEYFQRSVLATQSGTAAIHLALEALGIKAGDEVLCADFTFAATLNAILYSGATPVLLDAELDTWGMDPELLEIALRQRARRGKLPKAVIVTHVLGHVANLEVIRALCQKYHVWLLEDAAGALGSAYQGRPLGALADVGILSFNYNKILSTGGGGALITSEKTLHERSEYLAHQAKSKKSFYFHKEIGFNYRINGFGAGIGSLLWPKLAERMAQKQRVRDTYCAHLSAIDGVQWQKALPESAPNYWLNGILFPSQEMRKHIQSLLTTAGIETARLWKPMHQQPAYAQVACMRNGTGDILFDQGLALPSDITLTPEQIGEVCEVVKQGLA